MIEYPKIETLYDRDPVTHRVIPGQLRLPEFALPQRWIVTEKIDGTNIRVGMTAEGTVSFAGRTDKSDIPPHLMTHLAATYTPELMREVFSPSPGEEVVLFVEGFGAKIQKDGELYRPDVGSILFDVWFAGWWLEPENLIDVAGKLGIPFAPYLDIGVADMKDFGGLESAGELAYLIGDAGGVQDGRSIVASWFGRQRQAEGIVARTKPGLLMRDRRPLMWKLKLKDFADYREERHAR